MKKAFKYFLVLITILFFSATIFFFWGASTNLEPSLYSKVIKYETIVKKNTDSIYSIVTYNVGYLSGMTNNSTIEKPELLFLDNMDALRLNIKTTNPDIIAFQEIDFDSQRSFSVNQSTEVSKLGYINDAQTINWDKRYVPFPYGLPSVHFGKILSGQSLVSKFPITYHKTHILSRVESMPFFKDAFYLDRLAQVVSLEMEDQTVYIINVHLEAFDKVTREKQMSTAMKLYDKFAESYPTILLGDFNSDPSYDKAVISDILKDNRIGCAGFDPSDYKNTFDSRNPKERIDFIFYNKSKIQEISGRVLTEFGEISDHLPVEMRFKLKH